MAGGRPLKFQSVEELEKKIGEYFENVESDAWTITGLANALDTSRETLMNYELKEQYFDTIKRAKGKIEEAYEIDLRKKGNSGTIFALKNFGWKDKQEVEQTSTIVDVSETVTDDQAKKIAERIINGQ